MTSQETERFNWTSVDELKERLKQQGLLEGVERERALAKHAAEREAMRGCCSECFDIAALERKLSQTESKLVYANEQLAEHQARERKLPLFEIFERLEGERCTYHQCNDRRVDICD